MFGEEGSRAKETELFLKTHEIFSRAGYINLNALRYVLSQAVPEDKKATVKPVIIGSSVFFENIEGFVDVKLIGDIDIAFEINGSVVDDGKTRKDFTEVLHKIFSGQKELNVSPISTDYIDREFEIDEFAFYEFDVKSEDGTKFSISITTMYSPNIAEHLVDMNLKTILERGLVERFGNDYGDYKKMAKRYFMVLYYMGGYLQDLSDFTFFYKEFSKIMHENINDQQRIDLLQVLFTRLNSVIEKNKQQYISIINNPGTRQYLIDQVRKSYHRYKSTDSQPAEQSRWLASNPMVAGNPAEILENGTSIYSVLLPGTNRQVEVCLDPKTVKLMQELPEGVTLNIFGNQAIQMIFGREGVIAETGSLAEGDLDYSTRNNSGLDYLEMESLIKEHYGKGRELANCVPIGFSKLTAGPFTVSRLVIKLTSLGNGCFTIGFGEYMQERDYDDLIYRNVNVIEKMDAAQYETRDAIQGLIYHHRYGMHLEPEAVRFIKKTLSLDNINKINLKDMPSLRLDKLFKHAKNPGNAVADLYELGVLEGPFVDFVIDVLIETETLYTVLGSKEFLESDVSAKVMEIIRTHRSELLATHKAVNSAL
ncbi:MAG: hypothetical protein Q8N76_04725 [Candidatus Omnitrophota bacterium]|nr:hypothetical protein [Candidatus Omnitrophota bacterium]